MRSPTVSPGSTHTTTPRVLFVDQSAELGGAELSLLDVVLHRQVDDCVLLFQHGVFEDRLRDQGVDVRVCELPKSAARVGKTGGLPAFAGAGFGLARQVRAVASHARAFDVLYANTAKAFVVAAIVAVILRKPLIYHLRDILSASHFSGAIRWLVANLARLSRAKVIANSQATAEAFESAGGSPESVEVILNGIDLAPYDLARKNAALHRDSVRKSLGLKQERLLGVFGRLAPWKGQHIAIEAAQSLDNVHIVLVGSPLFGEDDYAGYLRDLASHESLKRRVHFLGFRDDVEVVMQAVDVIAHCSTSPEPFGRVIVEGMLSGRPVVASRAGGALEIIADEENGLLAEPGDAASLSRQVRRLFGDAQLSGNLVRNASESARERFDVRRTVSQINRLIELVAKG